MRAVSRCTLSRYLKRTSTSTLDRCCTTLINRTTQRRTTFPRRRPHTNPDIRHPCLIRPLTLYPSPIRRPTPDSIHKIIRPRRITITSARPTSTCISPERRCMEMDPSRLRFNRIMCGTVRYRTLAGLGMRWRGPRRIMVIGPIRIMEVVDSTKVSTVSQSKVDKAARQKLT